MVKEVKRTEPSQATQLSPPAWEEPKDWFQMVAGGVGLGASESARGEFVVGVVIIVVSQTDLLEVVGAAHAVGGLADLLHGGNQ